MAYLSQPACHPMNSPRSISGVAGGGTIQSANSVGKGVMIEVIVFCAVGFVAPVFRRFRRPLAARALRPAKGTS